MLAGILKIASEGVIVMDEQQRILLFSPGAEAIFGYSAEEIVGAPLERLLPRRYRAGHADHVRRFTTGPRDSIVMRERRGVFGLRKDGREFPLEASLSKQQTADGVMYTTIIRDITERRLSEAALIQSEERLRIALDTAQTQVFEADLSSGATTWVGRLGGPAPWTFDQAGEGGWSGVHPDDRDAARAAWRRHLKAGGRFRVEVRLGADERWVQLSAELIRNADGQPRRVVGTVQDITERRRAELAAIAAAQAAEAANEAKSAFLAMMSHEIRTPLNGVLGMAQVMAADQLSGVQHARLGVIRDSGEALLAILNDVLDLSKIEAGRMELEEREFELADLVSGVEATFAAVAAGKGLEFELDLDKPGRVYRGDPARLRQVLYNLVSNALKFTDAGWVRVACRYERPNLRITVADSGVGITPEALARLFTPFVQADVSTTRRFGGTGLGLAITRRLAELMGGGVEVVSAPGEGSTFTAVVPVTAVRRRSPGRADEPAARAPGLQEASAAVLVAEDNPTNQLVIRTLLEQLGLTVALAGDGREAIQAWTAGDFAIVLMDVQMPHLDGLAATRAIRQAETATGRPRTPIIGLTANAMAHQIAECLAAGMDQVLTKPLELPKLVAALQGALAAEAA